MEDHTKRVGKDQDVSLQKTPHEGEKWYFFFHSYNENQVNKPHVLDSTEKEETVIPYIWNIPSFKVAQSF